MSRQRSFAALLVLICTVGTQTGCGSGGLPTTHYYTLAPPPQVSGGDAVSDSSDGLTIGVESFAVNPPYDQDHLVHRESRDSSEIGFYTYHHWASPVGRLIQTALADGLRDVAGIRSIEPATSAGDYGARLGGRVLYLEHINSDASAEVRIAVELELRDTGETLWSASLEASATGEMDEASKVAALFARAFGQILDEARTQLAATLSP